MKTDPRALPGKLLARVVGINRSIEMSARLGYPLAPPVSSAIVITKKCNSRCLYCLSWQIEDAPELTLNDVCKLVDSLACLGVQWLTFSGGEPLLCEDLENMVAYACDRGLHVNVMTNGLLATTERIAGLVEVGLYGLIFSMDSIDPQVYTLLRGVPFEVFVKRLSECIEVRDRLGGFMISVHSVICRANLDGIPDLVRFLDDLGVFASFQVIHPVFNARGRQIKCELSFREEDERILTLSIEKLIEMKTQGYRIGSSLEYLKHIPKYAIDHVLPDGFHCRAGYNSIAIDNRLDLYPCWSFSPISNLRDKRLEDVWFSSDYQRMRERMWRADCHGCWLSCHTERELEARKRELMKYMHHEETKELML